MRIAYVCADPGVPVFGRKGCSVHVQEVCRAMLDQGARIDLFATRVGGGAPSGLEGVTVHHLPRVPKADLATREAANIASNDALRDALEREGPFDMVYERYSLWGYSGIRFARASAIPGILEVNAPLVEEQAEHRGLVNRQTAENIARTVFSSASSVLAVSDEVARHVRALGGDPLRIHIIPNGVNPDRFPRGVQPSLPAPPDVFTIGFVGTLKPWHGLATLTEAFELVHRSEPRMRLLIVGDGAERARIEADIAARGLTASVHFTGAVKPDDIPGLIASMDVATAPYPDRLDFYFSPLKVFEYMAAGVPVVASEIGQIAKVVQNGVTGVLCPPGDAAALAGAIMKLRQDPDLRGQLGGRARAMVLREHTWRAVGERILHLAGLENRDAPAVPAELSTARI